MEIICMKKGYFRGTVLTAKAVKEGSYCKVVGEVDGLEVFPKRFPYSQLNEMSINKELDEVLDRCGELCRAIYGDTGVEDIIKRAEVVIKNTHGLRRNAYKHRLFPETKVKPIAQAKKVVVDAMTLAHEKYGDSRKELSKKKEDGTRWVTESDDNGATIELVEGGEEAEICLQGRDLICEHIPLSRVSEAKFDGKEFEIYVDGVRFALSMVDPDPQLTMAIARRYR